MAGKVIRLQDCTATSKGWCSEPGEELLFSFPRKGSSGVLENLTGAETDRACHPCSVAVEAVPSSGSIQRLDRPLNALRVLCAPAGRSSACVRVWGTRTAE